MVVFKRTPSLELVYNEPGKAYSPGEKVAGRVLVQVAEVTRVSAVRLLATGVAKVLWSKASHQCKQEMEYLRIEDTLRMEDQACDSDGSVILRPGNQYEYKFSFELPKGPLGSTFKGKYGSVNYSVTIFLDRPSQPAQEVKKSFEVVDLVDVNTPDLMCPVSGKKNKKTTCLFIPDGSVSLSASINRKGFCEGDEICISADFENTCSRIVVPKAAIVSKHTYLANGETKVFTQKLCSVRGNHIISGMTDSWRGKNLRVPKIKPSILGCNILRVEYSLLIYVSVPGSKKVILDLPLVIGSTSSGLSSRSSSMASIGPPEAEGVLLAVFGGKGLIVLRLCIDEVKLEEVSGFQELHDWIWDLQWLKSSLEKTLYLGLALGHNSVALYDFTNQKTLCEVHCEEKCILYSAHFVGDTWNELLLLAGTVFNQLVIWRMADRANEEGKIKPEKRIDGHNGVIFSIFYLESKGLLASASDDRSLRLWQVGDLKVPQTHIKCLLVLYGHQSRVWSVKLLSDCILSIGEDSACIVWSYTGDIIHSFKGHKGRSIRAVATHESHGWVVTGGADAGIRLWQLKDKKTIATGLLQLNLNASSMKGSPKAVKLVDAGCVLVMTDAGGIYTYNMISKHWKLILEDGNYQSYSLLDVVSLPDNSVMCAIGNLMGYVKIFSVCHTDEDVTEVKLHEGKVHSLTWVLTQCQDSDLCSLFSSGPGGVMVWLEVLHSSGYIKDVRERCRYLLPLCKQRWHTSLVLLPKEKLIVCGDRRGSLLLYSCKVGKERSCQPASDSKQEVHAEGPVSLLFGIHGKLGVTSLSCNDGLLYSTGRDGCYRQLKVEDGQLKVLRKQKPCKGMDWIEKLVFTSDSNLLVMGFQSTDFVLWSTRSNEKLHCIPCGGGHRSWSYSSTVLTEVFAYIKSGDVFVYQSESADISQSVLKESLHGRELTCVKHAGMIRVNGEPINILVTSSEDTTVNVSAFSEFSNKLFQLSTVSDHISSVRTLALGKISGRKEGASSSSTVLFSAGGRAEIECYRLLIGHDSEHDVIRCQVVHLASHRLDEHWDRMKIKHKVLKMDSETRYMSIVVVDSVEHDLGSLHPISYWFLAAACSDGSVRIFLMSESTRRLLLVAESFHHRRCVLKVEKIIHQSADGERRVFLCSAATDGSIAFWDITATMDKAQRSLEVTDGEPQPADLGIPWLTVPAHQSGINSLHVREMKTGHYLVASGGDDNSLHICLIAIGITPSAPDAHVHGESKQCQMDHEADIRVLKTFSVSSAHAAHVTGLRILQPNLVVSASVDQRLTLWYLGDDGLRFLCSRFCHVADVSELDCWEGDDELSYYCVFCGQGLEIITCALSKDMITPSQK